MFRKRTHRRDAYTLLECMMASSVCVVCLVPALKLMRDAHDVARTTETRQIMTTLAVSKVEEHIVLAAAAWTNTTTSGNFSTEGYSTLRYDVTRSDAVANGGIVDKLMAITVTVYEDTNSNNSYTAGEPKVTFATKVAKMALYQDAAS